MAPEKITPSGYMRQLRPENYSDTTEVVGYLLDSSVFDHHLETITTRGQTQDFELFCRKLCERTICPNLRPHTGPDGGGDSKADTETLPVAEEIATLTYIGEPSAGREKWAFAFSAKEDWRGKVRSDVKGIAGTGRGYKRIIFVTSRYAPDKTRAQIEQELTKTFGIEVTIHDRSWVMKQVVESGCKDLAHNYLHVGEEIPDANLLGPVDYSRKRQLDAIEKLFVDPTSFLGMERQSVSEALLAAKISRTLERPRLETDGRFQRAIRLADAHGLPRQKLEVRYERLWTAVWWHDDYAELNANYNTFEAAVLPNDHAINLEFLSNLLQMLFNAVMHGDMTAEECDLEARSFRLYARLEVLASNNARPTNALHSKTLLVLGRLNKAMYLKDVGAIPKIWPEFSAILSQARSLGEYDATRLVKLIEAVGTVAGDEPAYDNLIEEMAEFVGERASEGEGAVILLNRAEKLSPENHYMRIRLLGKAARKLTKKEYSDPLIRALQLLSIAYRGAGLLWASRATAIFAAASISIKGEADSELDVSIVPTIELMAWTALQLRYIPDFFEAIRVLNGCLLDLPLADESKALLQDRLETFDMALGSLFLNVASDDLETLASVPDILEALGLFSARFALLYALGYEDILRADGSLPPDEPAASVRSMANVLASQPVRNNICGPIITNRSGRRQLETSVMGMTVEVRFDGTTTSTLVAEAVLASIEAAFATALELRVHPHTERYLINLVEDGSITEPSFDADQFKPEATLTWPTGMVLAAFERSAVTFRFLTNASFLTMAASCVMHEGTATIDHLVKDDGVLDRITMILTTANSFHRLFSQDLSSLDEYAELVKTNYPPREGRPVVTRGKLSEEDEDESPAIKDPKTWWAGRSHRDLQMRSVIDYNLWNAAGWEGTVYTLPSLEMPPALGLIFKNEVAGRAIFERWRQRFGPIDRDDAIYLSILKDVSQSGPAHYDVLITSNLAQSDAARDGGLVVLSRFKRMEPASNVNLQRFLSDYEQGGVFLFFPAVMANGKPKLLLDIAILKRNLRIKSAKALGSSDIEQVCLGKPAARAADASEGVSSPS